MKSARVRRKSLAASTTGLAVLLVCGLGFKLVTPSELTATTETTPANEERVAQITTNPFTTTMAFERTQTLGESSALIEIKIDPDGQYRIKECISGDILSKGVWQFNEENSTVALTHVGNYPMNNIFKVEPYIENVDGDSIADNKDNVSNEGATSQDQWQLLFLGNESTNLQYEMLTDGDIFIQRNDASANANSQEGVM